MTTGNTDLLFQDDIRETVRDAYTAIPTGAGRVVAARFYSDDELADVPEPAIEWALGVGNPVRHARLAEGETVLDLGCGAGIDTVLAARRVGPAGRVVGLDVLPEMRDRAHASVTAAGVAERCQLEVGEMEAIPLDDDSVDVVISNGVLNLSPRKSRALAEVHRVLRPGGRLCFADLTVEGDLPPEVLASEAAWAGCIAGAVSERVLTKKLTRVGFQDVTIGGHTPFSLDDVATYPLFTSEVVELMRRLLPGAATRRVAVGVVVRAGKPARDGARPVERTPAHRTGTTHLDEVEPDAVEAPGVIVRHLKTVEDVALKVLDVEPGGSTPFHTHPHAHEGVIISGAGELRLEGRRAPLRPGSVFSVRPTEPHAIANPGDEPLRFVCMDCYIE